MLHGMAPMAETPSEGVAILLKLCTFLYMSSGLLAGVLSILMTFTFDSV